MARPDRSGLRSLADSYINAEYASAARDGVGNFEAIVGTSVDYGPLITALAGNLIWAGACFATGGTAFVISLAGIGVGTASPLASGSVDRSAFHMWADSEITRITQHLLGQIVRVTDQVDAEATAQDLDDAETRMRLLRAQLRPEFIAVTGGLPTVSRSAIAHRVATEMLVKANAYGPGILSYGGGRFIYDYSVSGHFEEHGFWPFDSTSLKPEAQWVFARGTTQAYIPQGEAAALTELQRDPLLQPAQMPWQKTVYLHSVGTAGDIEIFLDAGNAITSARGYGLFEDLGRPPSRPASRSPPAPADPIGAARRVLDAM